MKRVLQFIARFIFVLGVFVPLVVLVKFFKLFGSPDKEFVRWWKRRREE